MAPDPPAATAADVALRSLTSHVLDLANRAHRLLRQAGRDDLAVRLDDEARRWRATATTIVVAGEVKRGKSSLLNALLDAPGLLPTGVMVMTAAPIVVSWADQASAAVERWTDDLEAPERLAVEPAQLAAHATGAAGVRRIDVRVPAALLRSGLVLVDTPGIGAMSAGHRDLTLGMLRHADALLFVTSAEEPLLRSEAEFLATAARRVADVLVVATKTDLVADGAAFAESARRRLGELAAVLDAGRLAELAGGPPPLLTSALLADRAREAADPARAAALLERSGVELLRAALDVRARDATRTRLANVAQTTAVAAETALADVDPGSRSRVPRDRRALVALLAHAGQRGQRELTGALNDLEVRYRDRVEEAQDPAALVRDLPAELEAALQGVWTEVLAAVDEELRAAIEDGLGETGGALPERVRRASGGKRLEVARPEVDAVEHGISALSATFLVGNLVFLALGPAGWLVGAAAGGGSVAVRALRQARARTRQQAAAAVRDAIREARQELAGELNSVLAERRAALEQTVDTRATTAAGDVAAGLRAVAADADAVRRELLRG